MPKAFGSEVSAFSVRVLRVLRGSVPEGGSGRPALAFFAATLIQGGAHGAMATCAGLLGQTLLGRQCVAPAAFVDSPSAGFPPLLLSFLGLMAAAVKAAAGALSMYGQKRAAFQVGNAVRREVTDSILQCGQASRAASDTHAALAVRLREVERGVDEGLLASVRAAAHLVPLALALVFLSPSLALVSLGLLAPFAVALTMLRKRLRRTHARVSRLAEQLHAGVDELVRHLDLWRTYGATDRVRHALATAGVKAGLVAARADAARAALSGANEILAAAALLGTVALVERGSIPLGRGPLVAFAAVFFLMYRPLRDLGDARTALERGALALRELDTVRADLRDSASVAEGVTNLHTPVRSLRTPVWSTERLEVRALSVLFGGHATPPTTFDAEPGEIVALVGPTGVGKTSLLRALLGLERSFVGTVRYGELDLTQAGVGPAERPFAWVPQEPAIVSGTLAENVALGAPESAGSEAHARAALESIGAAPLLARREGSALAAGGPELSGGERQWVAIARALASGLPVLLLDEPTSGLDPLSQERVLTALASLRGVRTVILVTHRPEPLGIADRVVTLGPAAIAP